MGDEMILACWPVADLPIPKEGSERGHHCQRCGAEVWLMPVNVGLGLTIYCRPCAASRAAETGDATILPAAAHPRRMGN